MANNFTSIDNFLTSAGLGSKDKAFSNMLYGLNHARKQQPVQSNNSTYGWTFFTRPQLNLRTYNLRNSRAMYPLLTDEEKSIQRFVRNTLDPRLSRTLNLNGKTSKFYLEKILSCPMVDEKSPFINILTNSIKTISGWPDEVAPTYTSTPGIRKEQISMVDGTYEIFESFDLNVTFENYVNDPLLTLFQTWSRYMALVFEGTLSPYIDMVVENEIDYNTRIYRITTDNTWDNLNYIGATGASFPISTPIGKVFDFSKDKPYSEQTKDINVRFKSMGAIYNDDILIKEFNETNSIFNSEYRAYVNGDRKAMEVIPKEIREIVNFRGYPYIDDKYYKIEWLISKNSLAYNNLVNGLKKSNSQQLEDIQKNKSFVDVNGNIIERT